MSLRRKKSGTVYQVYPMELRRVQMGAQPVYDRDTRGQSWVIIDLMIPEAKFVPRGADLLVTSDGAEFTVRGRRMV